MLVYFYMFLAIKHPVAQYDSIVVHAVGPPSWQAACVEVENLLQQHLAELLREPGSARFTRRGPSARPFEGLHPVSSFD